MTDAASRVEPFTALTEPAAIEDLRARLRATRWPDAPRGGHFAAFEEPELYARELREFFRPYRGELAG